MLIVKLWHYIRGYVIINIEGFTLEKFLNLVVKENIFIWDVHHKSSTCLLFKVSKKNFAHLKSIIRKVSCRLEIIDKKGLPFILWRMKKRKSLVAGASIGLIIIYILTSLIWTIEVIGNKNFNDRLIIEQLYELGVKEGEFKSKFDLKELEDTLLLKNQNLSYIHINFRGTKLIIELVEKEDPPSMIDADIPSNVIADRDGIVEKILVFGGKAMANEGDLVRKGDLLISGELTQDELSHEDELNYDDSTGKIHVHAWGDVLARTWYELEVEVHSLMKNEKVDAEEVVQRSLMIGGKEVIKKKDNISDSKYDKIEETIPIIDFLPIFIKKTEYRPKDEYIKLSESDIREMALEIAENKIEMERKKKIDIINSTEEIVGNVEEIITVRIIIEAIEKISVLEEIK